LYVISSAFNADDASPVPVLHTDQHEAELEVRRLREETSPTASRRQRCRCRRAQHLRDRPVRFFASLT
jgi:hypothetical protein